MFRCFCGPMETKFQTSWLLDAFLWIQFIIYYVNWSIFVWFDLSHYIYLSPVVLFLKLQRLTCQSPKSLMHGWMVCSLYMSCLCQPIKEVSFYHVFHIYIVPHNTAYTSWCWCFVLNLWHNTTRNTCLRAMDKHYLVTKMVVTLMFHGC